MYNENRATPAPMIGASTVVLVIILLLGIVILCMWGCPMYNVYEQRKQGEAMLAHSQAAKEVKVSEARATAEAAAYLAGADTVRAHGISRSQQIIGGSLTSEYLRWFFIDNLEKNQNAVFYIPTEGSIPIMEAGRSVKPITNPQ